MSGNIKKSNKDLARKLVQQLKKVIVIVHVKMQYAIFHSIVLMLNCSRDDL